jgi:hypothetical protein
MGVQLVSPWEYSEYAEKRPALFAPERVLNLTPLWLPDCRLLYYTPVPWACSVGSTPHSTRLQNHRALIIGGSGGIGRAVTYSLAAQGASVVCHAGHDREKLDRVVGYIRAHGGRARSLFAPIHRADDILPRLDEAGAVDILVVAMGPISYGSLAQTDVETWRGDDRTQPSAAGAPPFPLPSRMVSAGWGRVVLFGGPHSDAIRGFSAHCRLFSCESGPRDTVQIGGDADQRGKCHGQPDCTGIRLRLST